jgi:hypothetical protein
MNFTIHLNPEINTQQQSPNDIFQTQGHRARQLDHHLPNSSGKNRNACFRKGRRKNKKDKSNK